MLTNELLTFFKGPVAAALGTSRGGCPTFTRLVGVGGAPGSTELRIVVPSALAADALADLKENPAASVTVADVTNMQSRQFKGKIVRTEAASPDDHEMVRAYFAATTPVVGGFFGPGCGAGWARLQLEGLTAAVLAFDRLYDQTPGPHAGQELS